MRFSFPCGAILECHGEKRPPGFHATPERQDGRVSASPEGMHSMRGVYAPFKLEDHRVRGEELRHDERTE